MTTMAGYLMALVGKGLSVSEQDNLRAKEQEKGKKEEEEGGEVRNEPVESGRS